MSKPLELLMSCMGWPIVWRLAASSALAALGGLFAGLAPMALKHVVDAASSSAAASAAAAAAAASTASAAPPTRDGTAQLNDIAIYTGAYLLCLFIGRLLAEVRPTLASRAEQQLYGSLRLRFFQHVLALPLRFHLDQPSGALVHAQQHALSGCQIALLGVATEIIPVLVEGATVAFVLATLHLPSLMLAFAATTAAYLMVMRSKLQPLASAARAVGEASSGCTSLLADALTNIEPIKTFTAERRMTASYIRALKKLQRAWQLLQLQRLHLGLACAAIFATAMCGSLVIALRSFEAGRLTLGGLVMASLYLAQMIRPLETLAVAMRDVSQGLAFMAPFLTVLAEPAERGGSSGGGEVLDCTSRQQQVAPRGADGRPTLDPNIGPTLVPETRPDIRPHTRPHMRSEIRPEIRPKVCPIACPTAYPTVCSMACPTMCPSDDPNVCRDPCPDQVPHAAHRASICALPLGPGACVAHSRSPRVRFNKVCLAFTQGQPVLDALSLEVPAGQTLGIFGASGCGKSTLARLLVRLLEPQSGEIWLDDVRIDGLAPHVLREMIGVVPQDTTLFNATIGANIGMGRAGAAATEIERAARLAGLSDFIASLPRAYDTPIGERGLKLSGGERQRIAIARVILRQPRIYIFDEATSMLDAHTERQILETLRAVSCGRTTLTIAHRLAALRHADQIAVIAAGKVAECADHDTLIHRGGLYAAMWRAQESGGSV